MPSNLKEIDQQIQGRLFTIFHIRYAFKPKGNRAADLKKTFDHIPFWKCLQA